MSNGVDHNDFTYTPRSGSLNTIGWCGRRCLPSKQVEWAEDISKRTGIPLDNLDASLSETRPKDFMRGWYQNIDLLIVTAIPVWNSETGPLPTFEAIVSGIPAIGTPVGNFRDVPGPKFTTVDEAVTLVNELRQTPDRMKALALEQYNYVMAHYTYEVIAKSWRVGIQDAILRSSFQN
jgi:glycosyltransferase involved in cell wall biosynthesis